jgi:signal transduction histidine kinase
MGGIAAGHDQVWDHGLRPLDQWFTRDLRSTWPLDVGLTLSAVLGAVTGAVVLWFHVIFVLVTVAALMLPFKGFVTRFAIWVSTSAGLVLWAVIFREVPSDELTELPLMSLILIIVYIGAQARARAVADLERTQEVLLTRTELEIDGLRHQLQQAQRLEMLGRASTTMAHDLRNVFVVVGGAASELGPNLMDEDVATRAREILDATDRGIAIIGDLMTMGRQHDEIGQPIDLVFAVRQYEQLLRRLTPRNVELRIVSATEPIIIRVDRTSLLQVLMNLIVNAAEAIVGSGEITLTVQQVVRHQPGSTAPRACAQIIVRDNGVGISSTSIADVFEPGFTTKPGEHSGLGLATVHQIVELYKGSIELESSSGDGTTIRICLPLHQDAHCGPTDLTQGEWEHTMPAAAAPAENPAIFARWSSKPPLTTRSA